MKILSLLILSFGLQAQAQEIIDLGTYRADKVTTTERINVNAAGITEIRIVGVENDLDVQSARIFTDRGSESLYSIERSVSRNRVVSARVDPRDYIEVIELQTQSPLLGSRGKYRVEAVRQNFRPPPPRPPVPPRPRPPGPPRPGPDRGPYDPIEAREVYTQISSFAADRAGLNQTLTTGESMAREWTRRGRECGSSWEIDRMTNEFYRRADGYRRQRYQDRQARQYALEDVSNMSRCSDILRVN
jgi:hypothetical protein